MPSNPSEAPRRMVYVSQGNIPSRWAHTIQAMKMAEAFARLVPDFRLVTQAHWTRWLRPRFDYEAWYGIGEPFRIVRLPNRRIPAEDLIVDYQHPAFDLAASKYVRRIGADLVFTRSPLAAKHSVEAGIPTISEEHAPAAYSEFKWLQAIANDPKFLGLITIADDLKRAYVDAGIPERKILIAGSAVDLRRFKDAPEKRQARQQLGLRETGPIAVYCGHFYPHKGVDTLIAVARQRPDLLVSLAGGWPADVERLRGQTADLPNVRLHGFVPNHQIPIHLAAADVVVLPNRGSTPDARVTSPLKLFEYMASRRPIVASNIPAFSPVLRHAENAWLVEPESPDALAAAIAQLEANQDTGDRLAQTAWDEVQARTWGVRAATILDWARAQSAATAG